MRPVDTRKTLSNVSRQSSDAGIAFEIDKDRGKGSHQTLIFRDEVSDRVVKITLASGREISPGVQRRALSYAAQTVAREPAGSPGAMLATLVRGILDTAFSAGLAGDPQSEPKRPRK